MNKYSYKNTIQEYSIHDRFHYESMMIYTYKKALAVCKTQKQGREVEGEGSSPARDADGRIKEGGHGDIPCTRSTKIALQFFNPLLCLCLQSLELIKALI